MTDAQLQRIEDLVVGLGQSGARHEKWLESIDQRFGTLNGTVASLTKDSIAAKMFQAEHSKTVERIEELQGDFHEMSRKRDSQIAALESKLNVEEKSSEAAEKVNAKYRKRLDPWIDRAIWVGIALLIWNGQNILKAMGVHLGG
jgi:outer membrane murein-binding lipoprotein Lpp